LQETPHDSKCQQVGVDRCGGPKAADRSRFNR
jgi:hypothetical protein